ncbi:hypothetical protein NFI96_008467 [Prochilodus magdalenae]|nr:hypothetical protein NFI96_008467 [Prochilodus magdalenae]
MAATEANTEPVQADTVETKTEEEPANVEATPAPAEETQPTTEVTQSTEQPADKVKPASEKIWDSFLNKSGLGKVMGGKKKKEHSTAAEDAVGEEPDKATATNTNDQGDASVPKEQPATQTSEAGEAATESQAIEKVPDSEEVVQEQKTPGAKPKQGEKSSVRDFIRKPVARIFSHRSTEKKDGTGEVQKHGKVRSKSLDRLEDADANTIVVDQIEDPQVPEEPDKSTSQSTKHMKRWHSFKKLMAQKSHKKSTDDSKDVEGAEGVSVDAPGDTGTLDSTTKSEHSGQKRWKLKRSWTFQGLKRDPSLVGIHKPKDKDSSDNLKDENAPEGDQGDTRVSEGDEENQEKASAEGEEEKGATAATTRAKFVDQHANEIWTSFKKRVIPKSKKTADAGGGEEEPASEQEQTDEPQAGKDPAKTAKSKRTHFNRAVSLKNFILRKGKSTSVDMGEGTAAQKEGEGETKETDGPADTAGSTDLPQGGSEDQAATQTGSDNGAQVADEHKSSDGEEKSLPSIPSGQQSDMPHLAAEGGGQTEPTEEPKTNGENGCSDVASEDTTAHNHEPPTQNDDGKTEETNQEDINSSDKTCPKDGKILNQDGKCGTGNAVAQSGEFDAEIDSSDPQEKGTGKAVSIVGLGSSVELENKLGRGPQNGGSLSESTKTSDVPDDPEEALKRMLYEAATTIVRSALSAATEQLAKEKDLLDSKGKYSQATNNGNYTETVILCT